MPKEPHDTRDSHGGWSVGSGTLSSFTPPEGTPAVKPPPPKCTCKDTGFKWNPLQPFAHENGCPAVAHLVTPKRPARDYHTIARTHELVEPARDCLCNTPECPLCHPENSTPENLERRAQGLAPEIPLGPYTACHPPLDKPKYKGGPPDLATRKRRLAGFASALRDALDYMPSGYKSAADDRNTYCGPVENVIQLLEAEVRRC